MSTPPDVFISHVAEDGVRALGIALALEERGYRTWCYEVDNLPGSSYLLQISRAIADAKAVVLIISIASLESRQVTRELVRALEADKQFIPVLYGLTHEEFQNRQPEWRQVLGATASIRLPTQGVDALMPRLLEGLCALGVDPQTPAEIVRLERIRALLAQMTTEGDGLGPPAADDDGPAALPSPTRRAAPGRVTWFGGALFLLLAALLIVQKTSLLGRRAAAPRATPAAGGAMAVGVMEFRGRGSVPDWMRDVTRDSLNTVLSKVPGVRVYSKQKIDFLCAKRGLTEIEAAEMLDIRKMVSGSVSLDPHGIILEIQVIDIGSGVLERSERFVGREDQLIDLQNEAAVGLIHALNIELDDDALRRLFVNRTNDTLDGYRMLAETMKDAASVGPPMPKPGSSPEGNAFRWLAPGAAFADEPTAEPPTVDQPTVDEQTVRALLDEYQAALEAKDLNRLATLHDALEDDQRAALARYFSIAGDLQVRFSDVDLIIEGTDALATFTRVDTFQDTRTGKPMQLEIRMNSQLSKDSSGWKLRAPRKPA